MKATTKEKIELNAKQNRTTIRNQYTILSSKQEKAIINQIRIGRKDRKDPAFVYARVSDPGQEDDLSRVSQDLRAHEYADKNNLHVCRVYSCTESAMKTKRPVFRAMIEHAFKLGIKDIILKDHSRKSRNDDFSLWIQSLAQEHGMQIHYYVSGIVLNAAYLKTSGGRIMETVSNVLAAVYSEELSEKQVHVYDEKRAGGYIIGGRVCVGYDMKRVKQGHPRVTQSKFGKSFIPDMGDMILEGKMSSRKIATYWAEKTGLDPSTIRGLIRNPMLAGIQVYKGEPQRDQDGRFVMIQNEGFKPYFTLEKWEKIQAQLSSRATGRKDPENSWGSQVIFRRFAFCPHCDMSWYNEYRHTQSTQTPRRFKVKCKCGDVRNVREDVFWKMVSLSLHAAFDNITLDSAKEWEKVFTRERKNNRDAGNLIRALRRKLTKNRSRMQRARDAYMDGLWNKKVYKLEADRLEKEERELEHQIGEVSQLGEDSGESFFHYWRELGHVANIFDSLDRKEKEGIVRILCKRITIDPLSGSVDLHLNPGPDFFKRNVNTALTNARFSSALSGGKMVRTARTPARFGSLSIIRECSQSPWMAVGFLDEMCRSGAPTVRSASLYHLLEGGEFFVVAFFDHGTHHADHDFPEE